MKASSPFSLNQGLLKQALLTIEQYEHIVVLSYQTQKIGILPDVRLMGSAKVKKQLISSAN